MTPSYHIESYIRSLYFYFYYSAFRPDDILIYNNTNSEKKIKQILMSCIYPLIINYPWETTDAVTVKNLSEQIELDNGHVPYADIMKYAAY